MTDPGWTVSSRSFLRPDAVGLSIVMPPTDLRGAQLWMGGFSWSSEGAVRSDDCSTCVSQPVRSVLALPVFTSRISACILSRHHLNLPSVRLVQQNVGMLPEALNTYKWGFSAALILSCLT